MGAAGWALDRVSNVLAEESRERTSESPSKNISAMYNDSAPLSVADILGGRAEASYKDSGTSRCG